MNLFFKLVFSHCISVKVKALIITTPSVGLVHTSDVVIVYKLSFDILTLYLSVLHFSLLRQYDLFIVLLLVIINTLRESVLSIFPEWVELVEHRVILRIRHDRPRVYRLIRRVLGILTPLPHHHDRFFFAIGGVDHLGGDERGMRRLSLWVNFTNVPPERLDVLLVEARHLPAVWGHKSFFVLGLLLRVGITTIVLKLITIPVATILRLIILAQEHRLLIVLHLIVDVEIWGREYLSDVNLILVVWVHVWWHVRSLVKRWVAVRYHGLGLGHSHPVNCLFCCRYWAIPLLFLTDDGYFLPSWFCTRWRFEMWRRLVEFKAILWSQGRLWRLNLKIRIFEKL